MTFSKKIVLKHSDLKKRITRFQNRGEKVVFTNGCFDLLHPGHTRYLKEARGLGDKLIVAINSDSSINNLKGKLRPIQPEEARVEIIAALEFVDWVTLFNEATPLELIKALAPDILVKGGDWKVEDIVGADIVKSNGGRVFSIPITYKCSTSDIVDKIRDQSIKG